MKTPLQLLIHAVENDDTLIPSKKTLLLANLYDQINTPRKYWIFRQDHVAEYPKIITLNTHLSAHHLPGFFSLADSNSIEAIVDFANDRFGGGVLRKGFTQEEIILHQTNLLVEAGNFTGLTANPLYIRAYQTHEFIGDALKLYGTSELGTPGNNTIDKVIITPENVPQYFQKLKRARQISLIAIAAIDMRKTERTDYSANNLKTMFNAAYKAFSFHQKVGGTIIHTGAWGAGVFKNSEYTTCTLQLLAAQMAGITVYYHGSPNVFAEANKLLLFYEGQAVNYFFDQLLKLQELSAQWRPSVKK